MRSSKSRSRNKSNRQRTLGNIVNRVFDSSGPEGKVRGTPQQIIEKYLTLARDAQLSNDRVAEQSFLQHAEHYTRMLGEAQREMAERQQHHQNQRQDDDGLPQFGNGNGNGNNGNGHGYGRDGGREGQNRDGQNRDGQRDINGRENAPRDQAPRENASRDNANRDHAPRDNFGRDDAARDNSPRDNRGRDNRPARDEAQFDRQDRRDAPRPVADVTEAPVEDGLPIAVDASDNGGADVVDTPEAETKPSRARTPRARTPRPAGTAPARTRRKADAADGDADSQPTAPEAETSSE